MLERPLPGGDRASRDVQFPTIPSPRGADDQEFHSGVGLESFAVAERHEKVPSGDPRARTDRFQRNRSKRADMHLTLRTNIFPRGKPRQAVYPPLTPPTS